ncbi:MAG: hypothetical protein Q4F28_00310 [Eubacteriales bacterium]|nr:hypothetical protein [Eubacteriales bacterium]
MSSFLKKQGAGFYVNILAVIAAVAALITMVMCSTISEGDALNSFTLLVTGAVAGILLILAALYASNRFGNYDFVSTIAVMAAVALFSAVICGIIMSRILLISGLFSWNSKNMVGWQVFYASVTSIVCYVVSIVLMIIGSFMKTVR